MVHNRNQVKSEKYVENSKGAKNTKSGENLKYRFKKENAKSARVKFKDSPTEDLVNTNKIKRSVQSLLTVVILSVATYICYKGYLETRVNTPFDDKKVVQNSGLSVPDRYWGSYRPGNYFGLKTREPYSPVAGLIWYFPEKVLVEGPNFRHWCEQGDGINRYTWIQHDGKDFGIQEIDDGGVRLTTSFVKRSGGKNGGDWTTRINVTNLVPNSVGTSVSLLFYTAIEVQTLGRINRHIGSSITGIEGQTDKLGKFTIKLFDVQGTVESESFLTTEGRGLQFIKEDILSKLKLVSKKGKKHIVLSGDVTHGKSPNITAVQVTVQVPFVMDIVYESESVEDRVQSLTGKAYEELLQDKVNDFNDKFENVFKLKSKNFDEKEILFAQAAFSNLIGGIGYFYGSSRVRSEHTQNPVPYWKAPLYTSVPSRSFFPRGFLWDEGFHGLLLSAWDIEIEMDIISHWFDLMNIEGWIPREQILGLEALAKVPEEFVTQINSNANPPTFFLTLQLMLNNYENQLKNEHNLITLDLLFTRLVKWFDWFNTTQIGSIPGSYRWRGRDSTTNRELNPKTLSSGLDDYPRASHPSEDERHLDLRCWIALGAQILGKIANYLNRPGEKYLETYAYLADNTLLDQLHWSYKTESYSDFGLHTDDVVLKRSQKQQSNPSSPPEMHRVSGTPSLQYVDSSFGYVSLFPFFLQLIEPNSLKLNKFLTDLENPKYLWTDYGLRSLAVTSPLYMSYNTEHDPPYWRGPIWINMNYLALRSLNFYSRTHGPYKDKALNLYNRLRKNLISNIFNEYKRTGYIWEQYNDKTGEGQRSHPFTGWSSLVVLMMAEIY
uniref:Mannosyl-oligosaccharide glucosidase n=1 Tax=Clastoptera arizonana TaxID=38151 RepID=A0A1B6DLQ2_9HEMI